MTGICLDKTWISPVNVIYGALFLTLMISGLLLGSSMGAGFEGTVGTRGTVAETDRQYVQTGQRNLLIIGVDDLTSSEPHLRSVWLVIYFPGELDLTFVPLYPTTRNGIPFIDPELENSFGLDRGGGPSAPFFDFLGKSVWWDNYLLMDEIALADGIYFLGGVAIGGEKLDGRQVFNSISAANEDLLKVLEIQVKLLDSICNQVALGTLPEGIEKQLSRLADHYRSDLDLYTFVNEWRISISKSDKSLSCEFPTLDFITP
jgi:hypothetical protein